MCRGHKKLFESMVALISSQPKMCSNSSTPARSFTGGTPASRLRCRRLYMFGNEHSERIFRTAAAKAALDQLNAILGKCDGDPRPPDTVDGEQLEARETHIRALIELVTHYP